MPELPTIDTSRLRLRPFTLDDAPALARVSADPDVAATTLSLPHPYELSDAEGWIPKHAANFDAGIELTLAITMRDLGILVGNICLRLCHSHAHGDLGYLIAKPYWGRGYCTEAARALIGYAFNELDLHRVCASHFARNPASGRVMLKVGMRPEGVRRNHYRRNGRYEDSVQYGILRADAIAMA